MPRAWPLSTAASASAASVASRRSFGGTAPENVRAAARVSFALRANPIAYRIWGREGIDDGAVAQMDLAMRLPVFVACAALLVSAARISDSGAKSRIGPIRGPRLRSDMAEGGQPE